MERFLWSSRCENIELVPYAIIECSVESAKILTSLKKEKKKKKLWRFIADKLYEKYRNEFAKESDVSLWRRLFWCNNVLKDYDEAYEKLIDREMFKIIMEKIHFIFTYNFYHDIENNLVCYDKEAIRETVKQKINKELESLPVYVI